MTREQIRAKYSIIRIESPELANKELSDEEASNYESIVKMQVENLALYWNEDGSDDID